MAQHSYAFREFRLPGRYRFRKDEILAIVRRKTIRMTGEESEAFRPVSELELVYQTTARRIGEGLLNTRGQRRSLKQSFRKRLLLPNWGLLALAGQSQDAGSLSIQPARIRLDGQRPRHRLCIWPNRRCMLSRCLRHRVELRFPLPNLLPLAVASYCAAGRPSSQPQQETRSCQEYLMA